eukprot:GAHX01001977.1.p3 GENE.GAHX01001977.1~~GAHX01001977.1.p3  ORF type:complete len:71 (+),score=17.54 GAHX01001977.1:286-498(+)
MNNSETFKDPVSTELSPRKQINVEDEVDKVINMDVVNIVNKKNGHLWVEINVNEKDIQDSKETDSNQYRS